MYESIIIIFLLIVLIALVLFRLPIKKDDSYLDKVIKKQEENFLIKNNIAFAGIDMIGNHLTEINVTSPTGAKEIFDQSGVNPIELLFNKLL